MMYDYVADFGFFAGDTLSVSESDLLDLPSQFIMKLLAAVVFGFLQRKAVVPEPAWIEII